MIRFNRFIVSLLLKCRVHLTLNFIAIYTENFNFVMRFIWYNVLVVSLLALNLLFFVSDDQYNDKYSY